MHIYKIICTSDCGTCFMPYLQSITVIADSKEEALALAKKWLQNNGYKFIFPEDKWMVDDLGECVKGVFDYHYDSDY